MLAAALAVAIGATFAVTAAHAQAYGDDARQTWRGDRGSRWTDVAQGRLVDVQVQVEGRVTPLYRSPRGDARLYFQAVEGRRYAIRITNQTGQRVGVLLAVDGLNVIDGRHSTQSRHEPMYVLDPWESTVIRGWRSSLREVHQFVFVDEERSYAERSGRGNSDLGWIRVTTFRESNPPRRPMIGRPQVPYERFKDEAEDSREGALEERLDQPAPRAELRKSAEPPVAGQLRSDRDEGVPGTGWGERRHDPVNEVDFRAVSQPTDRFVLRYEYASGLRALGIRPVRGWFDRVRDRDRGEYGFAEPPRR
jgi:hypothetical protein